MDLKEIDEKNSEEPPQKKRLLSYNSSTHEEQENFATDNEDSSEESEDKDLPSALDVHFEYKISEKDSSGSLEYGDDIIVNDPAIGKFAYYKPVLENEPNKEPSFNRKGIADFDLKKNLHDSVQKEKLTDLQINFLDIIAKYFNVQYMKRTYENGEKLRFMYTLHILNHILKSRAKIIHHNSKLSKNPDEEYMDQGFTRPLAVILVPFRHDCYQIVSAITKLLPDSVVMNKKKFQNAYGPPSMQQHSKNKPEDYYEIFEGNTDEDFKIGLKIKNKSVKLYSEFYSSDLIIASPLGLRQVIGAEGDSNRDFDFLSSIEILVIDRADVLFLQNIVHFLHVLTHFNLLPKEPHGCDFSRVREFAIDGKAKYYRQTIFLSAVEHLLYDTVTRNHSHNYSGYLVSISSSRSPAIEHILLPGLKVCFRWFDVESFLNEYKDRFNFFIKKVLPEYIQDTAFKQTMIYIPSYFDYVKLRNYFRKNELSSVMVCEYTNKGKVAQARNLFFKGKRDFMLYTERAHFYNRYHIKGIQHILFYQPPTYPEYFRELCNSMVDSHPRRKFDERSCCIVACKFDQLLVKHLVGINETSNMLESKQKIFVKFVE